MNDGARERFRPARVYTYSYKNRNIDGPKGKGSRTTMAGHQDMVSGALVEA